MKKLLIKVINLIRRSLLRKPLFSFSIFLHNISYSMIKIFITIPNEKNQPKHKIVNYFKFFTDNVGKSDTVLDIGCAEGYLAYELSKKCKKVVGIEILDKKIKVAKTRYKRDNLIFVSGDATKYDYSEFKIKKFDKIILSNVLEHIKYRVKFLKSLSSLSDTILIRVPMITRDWLSVYKKENGYNYKLDPTHYTEYTLEQVYDEMDKAGFRVESYHINFGEFYGVVVRK
ncbi:MAG: class I SAM-dependent methyltransferase [Candidatus Woesearchaeota archaeon]|jgi:cyclopropane fatty-acyl-phospholipid synthase-like methyltransferase|nr:class I SAM-dependent methyltransferase [Candidatus Woesearchaeota archaeon]